MKQHEFAEAGHAGALDGLSSVMNGLNVTGKGSLRIDESSAPPKMAWTRNMPIVSDARNRYARSFEGFSTEVTCSRLKAYEPRMEFLRDEGENDGLVINRASESDFREFVRVTPNFRKGNLILMDNGNLRLTWKDQCGNRLGLQFLGGRVVQYVIFRKRHGKEPVSRVAGRDSFEGIERQFDAFDLHSMLHE